MPRLLIARDDALLMLSVQTTALQLALRPVLLVLVFSHGAIAQGFSTKPIGDQRSCRSCRILVEPLHEIDGRDWLTFPPAAVRADSRGRYWVLPGFEPPKVFDSSGHFVRQVGRKGNGPGEYSAPVDIVMLPGDSVLLIDASGFGAVISPDFEEKRRIRLPAVLRPSVVVQWPDQVVMAGAIPTAASIGLDLHLMSFSNANATIAKSFALDDGEFRPGMTSNYVLALSSDRTFWSANKSRYRIARWNRDGYALSAYERTPTWFPEASEAWAGNSTVPPPPVVVGIYEGGANQLWTMVAVAADTWREAWVNAPKDALEVDVRRVLWEKLYAAKLEVLDTKVGKVTAELHLKEFVLGFLPGARAVVYRVSEDGNTKLVILALSLRVN